MSDMVRLMNDVSALYEGGLIEGDGTFTCPVCSKEYKRKGAAEKHLEKEDCYRMQDQFEGTEHEKNGLALFQSILSETNPRARMNMASFVKSTSYAPIMRFILFTAVHDVLQRGLYYSWINEILGYTYMNKILSEGIKENRLREFRIFLQQNDGLIESEKFVDRYENDLIEDGQFFIRSIEKSQVSINYLADPKNGFPFDAVCSLLEPDYYDRLMDVAAQMTRS